MSFVSLANQVSLLQPPAVLGQGGMPGWSPSGSPAFMQPNRVYQTQDAVPAPATPPAAPAPVPTAVAVPAAPAPAPAPMSGISMLALGIGVGAFVLGTVLAVTAGR